MADGQGAVLRHLDKLIRLQQADRLGDRQLLERFVLQRDGDAFAALVRRHGPMVLGVCRRLLRCEQDAEDAFQATFLVLARNPGAVRKKESLAAFLYGVAARLAARVRADAARRRAHERAAVAPPAGDAERDVSWREVRQVLDEELQRLPEKYRVPLLLCYLEGLTQDEAARRLGWTTGTLRGRLERGRERLRARLVRRGLALSAALLGTALGEAAAAGVLPVVLAASTSRAALSFATGGGLGGISAQAAALVERGVHVLFPAKVKLFAALLAVGMACTGAGALAYRSRLTAPGGGEKGVAAVPDEKKAVERAASPTAAAVLEQALKAARAIKPESSRALLLANIAAAQVRAGDRTAARKTFQEAFRAVDGLHETRTRAFILPSVAAAQAKAGDRVEAGKTFRRAFEAAGTIDAGNSRTDAWQYIVRVQAEAGLFREARQAAESIKPDYYKGQVLADVAAAEARAGDIEGAQRGIEAITSPLGRARGWAAIAPFQARAGDRAGARASLKKAFEAAERLEYRAWKPGVLGRIALAQVQVEDLATARKTIDEARAVARRLSTGFTGPGALEVALAQAEAGDLKGARQALEQVLRDAEPRTDHSFQPWQEVANIQVKLGDLKGAFQTASFIARDGRIADALGPVLRLIAAAQAGAGDAAGALAWASKEQEPRARAHALLGVAEGMTQRRSGKPGAGTKVRSFPDPASAAKRGEPKTFHDSEYHALVREFEKALAESAKASEAARTDEERKQAQARAPSWDAYAARFLRLAEKYSDEPLALDALQWVVEFNRSGPAFRKALKVLARDHARNRQVGRACDFAVHSPHHAAAEALLRAVLAQNPGREARGRACLGLARFLQDKAAFARKLRGPMEPGMVKQFEETFGAAEVKALRQSDPDKVLREAEGLFERVLAEYADVKPSDHDRSLGDVARSALFEMRNLSVGKAAPEIEGEDVDGKTFRLSDYRGKVVVLDFWGHW